MEILKKTALLHIEQQTKDIPPEEVTDISLSGVPLLPERLTCFSALTYLTLVSLKPKLKTLQALSLAAFPSLRMLDVSDNAVTVAEELPRCPTLRRLFIANNCLRQWAEVERLAAAFPELEAVDVADNAVADASRFNDFFALFPKLVALDSRGRDGEEVVVSDTDESGSSLDEESDASDDSFIAAAEEETEEEEEEAQAPQNKRPRLPEGFGGADDDAPPAKVARKE
ncbi:uncharacterized protein Tco025E_07988 [Trypanosoma conorhini]|uniref:Uncharacterized protein n=1 Tax=Trypanosoma conorhini TaxID=83891 RepID=A0A422NFM8_9TRYP|nr:uncharacterized protein Tco025E_07988 [Trypanosoma conorhini]RNF04270.1 hypothetical protein Tco025E_07988 [Trypanosoma conorhini]